MAERPEVTPPPVPSPCNRFRVGMVPATCAACGYERRFHVTTPGAPAPLSPAEAVQALERTVRTLEWARRTVDDASAFTACAADVAAVLATLQAAPVAETPDYRAALKVAHELIQDYHAATDPELQPELAARADAILLPCDEADECPTVPAAPPAADARLVDLVREWQKAQWDQKELPISAEETHVRLMRAWDAKNALLAYPLPAPPEVK